MTHVHGLIYHRPSGENLLACLPACSYDVDFRSFCPITTCTEECCHFKTPLIISFLQPHPLSQYFMTKLAFFLNFSFFIRAQAIPLFPSLISAYCEQLSWCLCRWITDSSNSEDGNHRTDELLITDLICHCSSIIC